MLFTPDGAARAPSPHPTAPIANGAIKYPVIKEVLGTPRVLRIAISRDWL